MKQYEYYRYYIVFGCIAVVENWVQHGKKTPDQMAKILFSVLPKKMYLNQIIGIIKRYYLRYLLKILH